MSYHKNKTTRHWQTAKHLVSFQLAINNLTHTPTEYDWEFHFKNGEKRRYRHNQQTEARSYEEARKYCKQHYGEEYDLAGFNATFVVVDNKVQQARYREEYEDNVEKIK